MAIVTDERVALFVSGLIGEQLCPPFTCIGTEADGRIINGVIFNCFEGAAVHVTIAGHGWGREIAQAVGEYVFCQLDCLRMTITTEQDKVVRYAERLGGVREGVMRNHFGRGRDAIIVGILREDWTFPLRACHSRHAMA